MHVVITKKDILVLCEEPTKRLDDNRLTAEAKYPINFTRSGLKTCLNLHYGMEVTVSYLLMLHQFKAKDS